MCALPVERRDFCIPISETDGRKRCSVKQRQRSFICRAAQREQYAKSKNQDRLKADHRLIDVSTEEIGIQRKEREHKSEARSRCPPGKKVHGNDIHTLIKMCATSTRAAPKRVLDILEPTEDVDALTKLDLAAGVEVQINSRNPAVLRHLMSIGIVGIKEGMTRVFMEDGQSVPVTYIGSAQ